MKMLSYLLSTLSLLSPVCILKITRDTRKIVITRKKDSGSALLTINNVMYNVLEN